MPYPPRTKPAPGFFRRGSFVGTYNKSTPYKAEIIRWIQHNLTEEQSKAIATISNITPLKVYINYLMPIPKSLPKRTRHLMAWKLLPHVNKPDCSNMTKFAEDCVNNLLWPDDRQIIKLFVTKDYDIDPRIEFLIVTEGKPMISPEYHAIIQEYMPDEFQTLLGQINQLSVTQDKDQAMNILADIIKGNAQKFGRIARKLKNCAKKEESKA